MELVAILHNIRSLHNVGSIFRTADAAGVRKIYLTGITPGPLDQLDRVRSQFVKVSLGAEESVAWEKASLSTLLARLKKQGFKVYALEQTKGSKNIFTFKPSKKAVLILGNEVDGVDPRILKGSDAILEIPMHGKKESLNVSVAFGIAAYQMLHR